MGNQIVGIAPSQIYPVEHYLTGVFEADISLGSTRFFKVARAKWNEGLIVVKVFVKNDPSLPLEAYAERLEFIKKNLSNAVNCLPFQRIILTDKAGFIIREYVKHSLYDRISTRPFLTVIEKKWITFQILFGLHQCHKQKICHGDIKLENILITSWNWILLSDFASFKPTFLPEDNPADYTYFFDTSRRRTCYIAPERFRVASSAAVELGTAILSNDNNADGGSQAKLTPEMDIFSTGCALLELWSEGSTAPFEFSQLLAYRSGDDEHLNKQLAGIENGRLRSLLRSMLSRDPINRKSAELYLDEERGKFFPEYFYTFLQAYMQMFSSIPIMSADDKIQRLHLDIRNIIDILAKKDDEEEDGLILIATAVTANARGLNHCSSKLNCLEILQEIAHHTTSVVILDRILPTILYLTKDGSSRVRASAIDTVTICLALVKTPPRSDINVFPEYILPIISTMATDQAVGVRVALARNIANLAETSLRFLDQTRLICPSEFPPSRYERELTTLQEIVQLTISCLLTDSQSFVKQTLIETDIAKICIFLGRSKAYDIVLSHMITFLNDMDDKYLRCAFFDCIVGVAAFVGWTCSEILMPLLHQGLTDAEEFVIVKAVGATTALVELGLVEKPSLIGFIRDCSCFLLHPNLWIRHEICGLVTTAATRMTALDVQCKLLPILQPLLRSPLILVQQPEILMEYLVEPVPRSIYDSVVSFQGIEAFFNNVDGKLLSPADNPLGPQQRIGMKSVQLLRRLVQDGLTVEIERKLFAMKPLLLKINKYRMAASKLSTPDGKIVLTIDPSSLYSVPLIDRHRHAGGIGGGGGGVGGSGANAAGARKYRNSEIDAMSTEWQHMFGAMELNPTGTSSPSNDLAQEAVGLAAGASATSTALTPSPVATSLPICQATTTPPNSSSLLDYSMPERNNTLVEKQSDCIRELCQLKVKMRNDYEVLAANRDYDCYDYYSPIPGQWQMRGSPVAHLHEHKAAVTRMCPLQSFGSYFASVSADGTVRLWDCNRLDGHQSVNRSRQAYMAQRPLYCVAGCEAGQSLAVAGKDGLLMLLRIDPNSDKMALQQARDLAEEPLSSAKGATSKDGPIVDMQSLDQSAQNLIIYATLYGAIVGWDIRMPGYAWRMQGDLKSGMITSMCVDPTSSWLAIGTSGGRHFVWDLRFGILIAEVTHPQKARIRKIVCHPTERASLISASQGHNEVCTYNIETGHRQAALWASSSPPFTQNPKNSHSVTALLPGISDDKPFLLTAGNDQRIRYWDCRDQTRCRLVVPAPKDHLSPLNTCYECRLIDGTQVTQELKMEDHKNTMSQSTAGSVGGGGGLGSRTPQDDAPRCGPEPPPAGHVDGITDMVLCKSAKQTFVASASRDGVIKLWK